MTGIQEALPRILIFDVLNGASAFDATDSETHRVSKAADNSGLPFQRTLQSLVELCGVFEVDNIDISVGSSHNAEVVPHIHRVHAILALNSGGRALRSEIPVLDCLVPRARNNHGSTIVFEESYATYGLVVCTNHHILLRSNIANLDILVCAGRRKFCAVLGDS